LSSWRSETSADLQNAEQSLVDLIASVSGEPTPEQLRRIWQTYVLVEKSVAFVKFDLDEENPGRFIKLERYKVPDERQALRSALGYLKKGREAFAAGDFVLTLKHLRESRNYLRAVLREKRLKRNRALRRR